MDISARAGVVLHLHDRIETLTAEAALQEPEERRETLGVARALAEVAQAFTAPSASPERVAQWLADQHRADSAP